MDTSVTKSLEFFVFAMVELTILFVGISFIVGCINEFLPQDKVKRLLSGRKGKGYFIGAVLGGLTPFCSCSTIPMMVGLLKAGAGFGPTMSFLFASPLVNPVLLGLFFTLLGPKITVVYSLLALGLAICSGVVLEKLGFSRYLISRTMAQENSGCCEKSSQVVIHKSESIVPLAQAAKSESVELSSCCDTENTTDNVQHPNRWGRIFKEAVVQFKTFLPFIIVGVAIGSLIHGFLPTDIVTEVAGSDNLLAIPVSAVIGIPLYIRASTMLPIAASLLGKGMSLGAVIALIIGGAGASLPEVTMLKGLFRIPLLAAFLLCVFFTAVVSGFIMNAVIL